MKGKEDDFMALHFGFEALRGMEIPIPNDEQVLLVPRAQFCTTNGFEDIRLVFTDKGIHFRVKRSHLITFSSGSHSFCDNTFLAYNRIAEYKKGSALWAKTYRITMVDGFSPRFYFKEMSEVAEILNNYVRLDTPRDFSPYSYASHDPESVPHRNVGSK